MFSSLKYIVNRISLVKKVAKLDFIRSGIDSDQMPYMKLNSGLMLFGTESRAKDKKYYRLLPGKIKKRLPFQCFNLANDIVIRYFEGGLKYGGPRKESFYRAGEGDYIAEMGAYMGHYTLYLSEKVGTNGKVIAIEPIPDNLKILRKNPGKSAAEATDSGAAVIVIIIGIYFTIQKCKKCRFSTQCHTCHG